MKNILELTNFELFKQQHFLFLLTLAVTAISFLAGFNKVTGNPLFAMMFENRYGFNVWFMFFIGYAEIFGALSLWLKKWAFYGAQGLLVIGLGASSIHIYLGDGPDFAGMAWAYTIALILINIYHFRLRQVAADTVA